MSKTHQEVMNGFKALSLIRQSNNATARNCVNHILAGDMDMAKHTAIQFRTGEVRYRQLFRELHAEVQVSLGMAVQS